MSERDALILATVRAEQGKWESWAMSSDGSLVGVNSEDPLQ